MKSAIIFGVVVHFGGDEFCQIRPCVDREGVERPSIYTGPACTQTELYDAIWHLRGRYDWDRAHSGLSPFDWGDNPLMIPEEIRLAMPL